VSTVNAPLSVVVPSHSRADLLRLCLTSVTRFAPPGTQVVVVDDGSADTIVSRVAGEFPGVEVIRLPRAAGFCVAANAGIAAAAGDVVELLNDDAEVTAGWADAALRWFADPVIGAVAPLVLQNDPDRIRRGLPPLVDSAGDEYDLGGFARKRWHGTALVGAICEPCLVWGVSATAGFYRRETLIRAGGFPPSFRAYFEDVDLSFRLRRLGYGAWFDPASIVWHRVSASYGRNPSRTVLEQQSRNEELVFWRNVRGRDRLRYLPRHAAVIAAKAVRRWQEGNLGPWVAGRVRGVLAACGGK
jgi:GT2 family glycosyltransferase